MSPDQVRRPVQVSAAVLANEPSAAYRLLVLQAPEVAAGARPGQFVALAVGGPESALLLRRAFSLHGADPGRGTITLVVAAHGPGSAWVARRREGDVVDVIGPLGRPFPDPPPGAGCVLVGGGYGSAPLLWWGARLKAAGHRVDVVLGAASRDRLFGVPQGLPAYADAVEVTTDDGTAGVRGRVTDVLAQLLACSPRRTVYACGPMAMLRAVAAMCSGDRTPAWCAVEEAMACGIGVCMTCVLPVRGDDGLTRMVRSCVEGPTFAGDRVRWDAGTGAGSGVPADCVGAPAPVAAGRR
jgi:dihydroorotate dehydrogenase electron transfer subunit